jgi:MoaA/NifB/PqqE/SkfB family radical SAM enzyme
MKHNKYSHLKIFQFPKKIRSFQYGLITAPLYVRIKPTNRCSHACHWCVYSDGTTRPKDRLEEHLQSHMHETMAERDQMPFKKAVELILDLAKMGVKAVTFSGGGEPLIYPGIEYIISHATARGLDVSIITNGQSLVGAKAYALRAARWVRVSMDYSDADQMVASRNVPARFFEEVIENMRTFAKYKKRSCDLGVNFIVTRENHTSLIEAASLLKSIGVENVRFSPVYLEAFREYHAPIAKAVNYQLAEIGASIVDEGFTVNSFYELDSPSKIPHRPFHRCLYMQTVPVVGADLNVYACHNTAYSKHGLIGSIRDRTFSELWFSEEAKKAFGDLDPSKVCNHECANHAKVELFNQLADASSDNFV